ncbi:MAG TPA: translocation/assembly module TamB domain-containing protein [Fimbriimonas sp.]|nr:translocation/assembly module TamB domain-containing protein [Fimbriimonas sp.]
MPALLIAWLGYIYLRSCVELLADPHRGIKFSYTSPGGDVRLQADSYRVDIGRGAVDLQKLQIVDPGGGLVAAAKRISIGNLHWLQGANQRPEIAIKGLSGTLVRLPNGSFPLFSYLPKQKPSETKTPFHVEVKGADVLLVDQEAGGWSQRLHSDYVEVSGLSSDWVAHGAADLPGMGSALAEIQHDDKNGLRVDGSTTNLDLGRLVNHVLKLRVVRPLTALRSLKLTGLQVSGPFRVFVPTTNKAQIEVEAKAFGQQVAYGPYVAERLEFQGLVTTQGLKGVATGKSGGTMATLTGSSTWTSGAVGGGQLQVKAASVESLPVAVRKFIPAGVKFSNGEFDGWVSFGKGQQTSLIGNVQASTAAYQDRVLQGPLAAIMANAGQVLVHLSRGSYQGLSPAVAARFDLKGKTVSGYVSGQNLNLSQVAKLFKQPEVRGTGAAQAFVMGPWKSPTVRFVASGSAIYQASKTLSSGLERFDAEGTYHGNAVQIDRAEVWGESGVLTVKGHSTPGQSTLAMQVQGRGITPGSYVKGLSGVANFDADVTGTFSHPKAHGRLEGTDLAYQGQSIPAAAADFSADRNGLALRNVGAVSGAMSLAGQAGLTWKNQALSGKLSVSDIEAAQFFGDGVAGILNAPSVSLSGTLKNPVAVARVEGSKLIGEQVLADSLEALLRITPSGVTLDHATAEIADGAVSATGSYAFGTKSGDLTLTSTPLELEKLMPALGQTITVGGTVTIRQAHATYKGGVVKGNAEGMLDKVVANGALAGSGNWSLDAADNKVHGTVSVGELLPELRVIDLEATYDFDKRTVDGAFDADRARLQDIVTASQRYVPTSLLASLNALSTASGDVTLGSHFSGPVESPNLLIDTFEASNLNYKGQLYGSLTGTKLTRENGLWSVPGLNLKGPEGTFAVNGTVRENGPINLNATGDQVLLAAFSPFDEDLLGNAGVGRFNLKATGDSSRPAVSGTINIDHLAKAPTSIQQEAGAADQDLSVSVPHASLSDKSVHLDGTYRYAGFTGSFDGDAPFRYGEGIGSGSVSAHVALDKRPISEIPFFKTIVDPSHTSGVVSGDITAAGPLRNVKYSGGITLTADSLAFRSTDQNPYIQHVDDQFKNLIAQLGITAKGDIAVNLKSDVSGGGSLALNLATPLFDPTDTAAAGRGGILGRFLDGNLTGNLSLNNTKLRQSFKGGGYVAMQVNGSVPLGGTIRNPTIGTRSAPGSFTVSHVDTQVPTLPAGGGEESTFPIDPSFYVDAALADPATIRSSSANLALTGDANLRGKLSNPRANANLVVNRGTITLPGGTVRLDDGGTVNFSYRKPFADQPLASVDVDLVGHTSVTAAGLSGNVQRYNITLNITGDLLKQEGLQMDAISDPPDLASDQVLALLGQKNLLESLGSGDQSETERRIRDALFGVALPSLVSPLTSGLAQALGLDFISFDYNATELTTLSVARSISPDFTLQYRQQVGTPPPGFRSIYDFRIVYTPRKGPPLLRRLSLSAGADQDRPWKVSLEYGLRFGGSSDRFRKKTIISP